MKMHNGLAIPPLAGVATPTVASILRAYGASMWLPGITDAEGNYVNSAGTPPTAVSNDYIGYAAGAESAIYVNQATTGFKPQLRGGFYNKCQSSGDLSYGFWLANGGTKSAGNSYVTNGYSWTSAIFSENETVAQHYIYGITTGAPPDNELITVSAKIKWLTGSDFCRLQSRTRSGATVYMAFTLSDGVITFTSPSVLSYSIRAEPGGFYFVSMTFDVGSVGSTAPNAIIMTQGAITAAGVGSVLEIGWFQVTDSTRADDILIHSTVVPWYTNVAPFHWKFDGIDDKLQMSAVALDPAADHFMLACLKVPAGISIATAVAGIGNAGANERCQLAFFSNQIPRVFWRDTAGVAVDATSASGARAAEERIVMCGRKNGTSYTGRIKSNLTAAYSNVVVATLGAWVPTISTIGSGVSAGSIGFPWSDCVYGVIHGNGAPTDDELLFLENFLAGYAGFTPLA